jgi:hypothetical protein
MIYNTTSKCSGDGVAVTKTAVCSHGCAEIKKDGLAW